jgi:hypothetical protein
VYSFGGESFSGFKHIYVFFIIFTEKIPKLPHITPKLQQKFILDKNKTGTFAANVFSVHRLIANTSDRLEQT